jgi:fatty acid/phospholipid biosynthesis enzyme
VAVADWLERELRNRLGATDAAALAARLRALLGPIEERGGVLLGVRGAFVMGHGRAGPREVAAIIEHAVRVARSDLLAAIAAEIARVRPADTVSHG